MKRFAAFYLPLAALMVAVAFAVGEMLSSSVLDNLQVHQVNFLTNGADIFINALSGPISHLQGMTHEPAINRAFQAPPEAARSLVDEHLRTLLYRNPSYDQVRWLNAKGMERARINRTAKGPLVVSAEDLQDKSARYYFQQAIRLAPGQIYLSPLDLNVEDEVVEIPYKPTIRLAIRLPVVEGQDQGLLIINMLAQPLLDHLLRIVPAGRDQQVMLLNPAGYWLLSPDSQQAWGFMLGRADATMAQYYPAEWQHIRHQPEGQTHTNTGLWAWTHIDPASHYSDLVQLAESWQLVSFIPAYEVNRHQWQRQWPLIPVTITALLVLAIGVYFYRKLVIRQERDEIELRLIKGKQLAEEQLILATDGAELGIWYWDMTTDKITWSDRCKTHLGQPSEQIPSLFHFYEAIHPADRHWVEEQTNRAVAERSDSSAEYRVYWPDGHLHWISARGRVYSAGPKGVLLGMGGITQDITGRKQIEQALYESDERLNLFIKYAPAALGMFDRQMCYVAVSQRWLNDYGLDGRDIIGLSHYEVFPEIGDNWKAIHQRGMAGETITAKEDCFPRLDGTVQWLRWEIRPWPQQDGTIGGILIFSEDITQRKQAEQNLRESEQRFRDLFEHLPIAYQSLDIQGRWLDSNNKMAELLGFDSPKAMLDHDFIEYWDDSIKDQFDSAYDEFKTNHSVEGEIKLIHRDGSPRIVQVSGRIQRSNNGLFLRTHCVLIDVTERRRMEYEICSLNQELEQRIEARTAALQASESRFRALFEDNQSVMLLIDSDTGALVAVNQAAIDFYGYSKEALLRMSIQDINTLPPEQVALVRNQATHREKNHFHFAHRLADGLARNVDVYSTPIVVDNKTLLFSIVHDETARLQAEQALQKSQIAAEAANQAKGDFLANMSHELRSPMNCILGMTTLLLEGDLTSHQRDYLSKVNSSSKALLRLLNDVLDYSKIEAGQLDIEQRPFELADVIRNITDLFTLRFEEKGLNWKVIIDPNVPPHLIGDSFRLTQVLVNLIGNAVKFTKRGQVCLAVESIAAPDTMVRLGFTVQDTGIGMTPTQLSKLFATFTQGDTSTTRKYGGSGLGLAISKQLLTLMGGEISAESEPDVGSRFSFTVTFQSIENVPYSNSSSAPSLAELATRVEDIRGARILVVDDQETNLILMEELLKKLGFQPVVANSGSVALALMTPNRFAAVLMDLQMPEMDGYQVTQEIQARLGIQTPPILAVTAAAMVQHQQASLAAGMREHLSKPVDPVQLVNALIKHIPPRQLQEKSLPAFDSQHYQHLKEELAELANYLAGNDFQATRVVSRIENLVAGSALGPFFAPTVDATRKLAFKNALAALTQFQHGILKPLP